MTRQNVKSSVIKSIGYNAPSKLLEVEFMKGNVYQYSKVEAEVPSKWMEAESKGRFFLEFVRNSYQYRLIIRRWWKK